MRYDTVRYFLLCNIPRYVCTPTHAGRMQARCNPITSYYSPTAYLPGMYRRFPESDCLPAGCVVPACCCRPQKRRDRPSRDHHIECVREKRKRKLICSPRILSDHGIITRSESANYPCNHVETNSHFVVCLNFCLSCSAGQVTINSNRTETGAGPTIYYYD